jgi:hypothetical protein
MYIMRAEDADRLRNEVAAAGGLASQADLARRWGVARQRVHEMVRDGLLPTPIARVGGRPVWLMREASDAWWSIGRPRELDP